MAKNYPLKFRMKYFTNMYLRQSQADIKNDQASYVNAALTWNFTFPTREHQSVSKGTFVYEPLKQV
jgi:hypothetical protein